MNVKLARQMPVLENPFGLKVKRLYDSESAEILHLSLEPGEKTVRHISPVDVAIYVLCGQGSVDAPGEFFEMEQGAILDSRAGTAHRICNTGDGNLDMLIMKAPKPNAPIKIVED